MLQEVANGMYICLQDTDGVFLIVDPLDVEVGAAVEDDHEEIEDIGS